MKTTEKNHGALSVVIVSLLVFSLPLSLETACSQETEPQDISEVLNQIGGDAITMSVMDRALPRLSDDTIILRLRGGDPFVLRGGNVDEGGGLRRCFVTTAYVTAAIWDWSQFGVTQRSASQFAPIKRAMEIYLTKINQRLGSLGGRDELVQKVDKMKDKFKPSETERPNFGETARFLATLSKEIQALALERDQYDLAFTMGQWLVWQAQLANLCLGANEKNATYLQEVMNQRYRLVKLVPFAELSGELLGSEAEDELEDLKSSLEGLEDVFLLDQQEECESVQTEAMKIFKIFDLTFPSLEVD